MKELDYLLYDNQTRSSIGRDWGLKAATGALGATGLRSALQESFIEYCNLSFNTHRDFLRGFGYAIGGIPAGVSYLLCVTLERPDFHGRPSCVFVGLLFTSHEELRDFLSMYSPVATAEAALHSERLPTGLVPLGNRMWFESTAGFENSKLSLDKERAITTAIFIPERTPAEVVDLLLETNRLSLPKVLGVTALRDSQLFVEAKFDLVCGQFEMPVTTHRPGRLPASIPVRPPTDELARETTIQDRASDWFRQQSWQVARSLLGALVIVLILASGTQAYRWWCAEDIETNTPISITQPTTPPEVTSSPEVAVSPDVRPKKFGALTDEAFLNRMKTLVEILESLDPQELKKTRAYGIVKDVPLAAHQNYQKDLRRCFEVELPNQHKALTDENLMYYFQNEDALQLPAQAKAEKIRAKVFKVKLSSTPCEKLKDAFLFEFRNVEGPLATWCETLNGIRELGETASGGGVIPGN